MVENGSNLIIVMVIERLGLFPSLLFSLVIGHWSLLPLVIGHSGARCSLVIGAQFQGPVLVIGGSSAALLSSMVLRQSGEPPEVY